CPVTVTPTGPTSRPRPASTFLRTTGTGS
ncbi:MAG: hypothetical protein AVDCRST_MAG05-1429, partial [uncultured Rubrobacteraceae bacterium]